MHYSGTLSASFSCEKVRWKQHWTFPMKIAFPHESQLYTNLVPQCIILRNCNALWYWLRVAKYERFCRTQHSCYGFLNAFWKVDLIARSNKKLLFGTWYTRCAIYICRWDTSCFALHIVKHLHHIFLKSYKVISMRGISQLYDSVWWLFWKTVSVHRFTKYWHQIWV